MNTRNGRNERGRSRERSPLRPHGYTTPHYGGTGPVPRPSGQQPPPPYSTDPGSSDGEYKEINCNGSFAGTFILFIVVVFISFYFLPTKTDRYIDSVAQMRVQQGVMREEAKHLDDERQSLEHERLVLEEEREKWEKAYEDSRVQLGAMRKEAKHLEDERRSLEYERLALKEERERWEKAHNDSRVPQGAFWEVVWPRWECRAYGKREYWGILRNVPQDRSDIDACMNMPVEIKGVTVRRPDRCQYMEGSPYIHGFWMVDWDQPDCKPWHRDFHDRGCTNPGSGTRRIEAEVTGINKKGQQDWHVLCETTPMTWKHITYGNPTHCDERDREKKIAMWDIPDSRC